MLIRATVAYVPLEIESGEYTKLEAQLGTYTVLEAEATYRKLEVAGLFANWNSLNQRPHMDIALGDLVGIHTRKSVFDILNVVDQPLGFYRTWGQDSGSTLPFTDVTWFALASSITDEVPFSSKLQVGLDTIKGDTLPLLSSTALRFIHTVQDELQFSEEFKEAYGRFSAIALLEDLDITLSSHLAEVVALDEQVSRVLVRGLRDDVGLPDATRLKLYRTITDSLSATDTITGVRRFVKTPVSGIATTDAIDVRPNIGVTNDARLVDALEGLIGSVSSSAIGLQDTPVKRLTRALIDTIELADSTDHIKHRDTGDVWGVTDSYSGTLNKLVPEYTVLSEELGKEFVKGVVEDTASLIEAINKLVRRGVASEAALSDDPYITYEGRKTSDVVVDEAFQVEFTRYVTDSALLSDPISLGNRGTERVSTTQVIDNTTLHTTIFNQDQVALGDVFQYALGSGGSLLNSSALNTTTLG